MSSASESIGASAPSRRRIIGGASLGTLFEWYDFFLYGALTSEIAKRFFVGVDETTSFVLALAAFGAGFAARPLGALVFGHIGDRTGRKNTFLATMALMGVSTFLVGVLPDAGAIGIAAPILLVLLRILQGMALGGEYGGAAIYVAEHAPADRRAFDTSWINAMATVGLVLSLIVVIACRLLVPAEDFVVWGWRLPFLLSIALLGVSLWIRMRLGESPVFEKMKAEGAISRAPFADSFGRWANFRNILVVFAMIAGGTSVFYTAQFYALFFLKRTLMVDALTADALVALGLAIAAPTYLFWGWLSDRIGRKPVLLASALTGALILFPMFHLLTSAANPALASAQRNAPIVVYADQSACAFQFDPLGQRRFDAHECDVARSFLSRAGVSYQSVAAPSGAGAQVRIGQTSLDAPALAGLTGDARQGAITNFQTQMRAALDAAGYPTTANPAAMNIPLLIAIMIILGILAALVYAPIAAFLVELFPAHIRYTSLSAPYNFATGWIGGFLPATAFAIVAATGDIYAGLWYPIGFAILATIVVAVFVPETRGRSI